MVIYSWNACLVQCVQIDPELSMQLLAILSDGQHCSQERNSFGYHGACNAVAVAMRQHIHLEEPTRYITNFRERQRNAFLSDVVLFLPTVINTLHKS